MKFRYLRDPLFASCVVLYFVNRFLLKRIVAGGFFHDHLNDLICIPLWVPITVLLMRKVGLRREDVPPQADEVLVPLVMWSVIFEIYLPRVRYFEHLATADYADVLWYTIGALAAAVIWQATYQDRHQAGGSISGLTRVLSCPQRREWNAHVQQVFLVGVSQVLKPRWIPKGRLVRKTSDERQSGEASSERSWQ